MSLTGPAVDPTEVVAGRYRRDFLLGRGGMGTVWAATDLVLHRWVALKRLDVGAGGRDAAVLAEAKAAARLAHPGIVTVHDVVADGEDLLLVTEYLGGGTLADHVRRVGPLGARAVAALGARLAGGLAAAHGTGVVHADVKPANVLLVGADPAEAKLGDFGLASVRGDAARPGVESLGSPGYLAPERITGTPSAEPADVYGLAATLWFALTGAAPHQRPTVEATLAAALAEPLPPAPAAGPVVGLLAGALDRDPAARPTAAALAHALALAGLEPGAAALPASPAPYLDVVGPLVEETTTIASLHPPAPAGVAPARRPRRRVAGVVALALLAAAAGGALLLRADDDPDPGAAVDVGAGAGPGGPGAERPEPTDDGTGDDGAGDDPPGGGEAAPGTHVDPEGAFRVVLPEGLAVEVDTATHLTEAVAGDLRVAIRWFEPPVDPAAFLAEEEARLVTFPAYRRLALEARADEATWRFEFARSSEPARLLTSTGRAFVLEGRTYAVFVRSDDPAEVAAVLAGLDATFVATP